MTLAKTRIVLKTRKMNFDEYWKKVMDQAEKTLCGLFDCN